MRQASRFRIRSYRAAIHDDQLGLRQAVSEHGETKIDRRGWLFNDCVQMSLAVSRACVNLNPIALR